MIEFGGITYIIDFKAMDALIGSEESLKAQSVTETDIVEVFNEDNETPQSKTVSTRTYQKGMEIDGAKYDTLRLMFEAVMSFNEDIDTSLGMERALSSAPLSFKLAFNTLLHYGILAELEE
jgi:hypothetical protein